jgi:predicted RNase H-like HicB family nuclease
MRYPGKMLKIRIESLDEAGFLATSEEIQGLVAQGRTVQETLDIARHVARRLLEALSQCRQPATHR